MLKTIIFDESNIEKKISIYHQEIHVWIVHWRKIQQWTKENWWIMDDDEKNFVLKYKFYDDCMRSATGKVLTRFLLAKYLNLSVSNIQIVKGEKGKPSVKLSCGDCLEYSVSHSGEIVALAFTKEGRIGVDTEEHKYISEYESLAKNFFSVEESDRIIRSKSEDLFFKYWTAKEAYVKALGVGLYKSFKSFYINGNNVFDEGELNQNWEIIFVNNTERYYTSIAIEIRNLLVEKNGIR